MEEINNEYPQIRVVGETSILVEFEPEITEGTLKKVLSYKSLVENKYLKEEVEVIPAYNSLLIKYHLGIEDAYSEISVLKRLFGKANLIKNIQTRIFHLPVCYDAQFSLDLPFLSDSLILPEEEIIKRHTAPLYTVYFLGFLPGFLYLGGLDNTLHFPRKNSPRMEVPKGAVGIGGKQTGIYPRKSPGGWQIIGNSPVQLFDPKQDPPCEISAGDKLKFYSVTMEEYLEISEELEKGNIAIKSDIWYG